MKNNNEFLSLAELLPPFLKAHSDVQCWICDSCENLSQEHRIKASDIRRQFGERSMFIGGINTHGQVYKIAQSSKSKHFKFRPSICRECNTSITQESDFSYEFFVNAAEEKAKSGLDPNRTFEDKYFLERRNYLALFRYFAKLMGCHLNECGVPIPSHLARFVAKQTNRNCIWLSIRLNTDFVIEAEQDGFAAHGGLVIIIKEPTLHPIRFHSARMIGSLRMFFWYDMTLLEIQEMRFRFPEFVEHCAQMASETIKSTTLDNDLQWLGLKD